MSPQQRDANCRAGLPAHESPAWRTIHSGYSVSTGTRLPVQSLFVYKRAFQCKHRLSFPDIARSSASMRVAIAEARLILVIAHRTSAANFGAYRAHGRRQPIPHSKAALVVRMARNATKAVASREMSVRHWARGDRRPDQTQEPASSTGDLSRRPAIPTATATKERFCFRAFVFSPSVPSPLAAKFDWASASVCSIVDATMATPAASAIFLPSS